MKRNLLRGLLGVSLFALVPLSAFAHADVRVSVGLGLPIYVEPPPVYYEPAPRYYRPAPPVYYGPEVIYRDRYHDDDDRRHHDHGRHRGHDRDR